MLSRARRALRLGGVLVVLAAAGTAHGGPESPELRRSMREIFSALSLTWPLSLDARRFAAPAGRGRILEALRSLDARAAALERHGAGLDLSYGFLRRTLAADAREAYESYRAGEFSRARYLLGEMTDACFRCHSRRPGGAPFELGERFLEQAPVRDLGLAERARLAVVTRQFERALELYEALFEAPQVQNAPLAGALEGYLEVAIRVAGDLARPVEKLQALRRRPGLPPYLREHVAAWLEALEALRRAPREGPELERARRLIHAARLRSLYPADPTGLVHYIAASGLLHHVIESRPPGDADLPEAFYLLGVADSHMRDSRWPSETEYFLETAIRLAPGSATAADAYAFLREYVIAGYTGSSGVHLPGNVHLRLEAMRRLALGE